jgi:tight adherence protein B
VSPGLILGAGAACVVLVLGASALILAYDSRNRRLALRIAERVTPLAPARPPERSLSEQIGLSLITGWLNRLAGLCGFQPERQEAYPLQIPLLLSLLVIPAVAIDRLISPVLGLSLDPALPLIWIGCCQMLFRALHGRYAGKLYRQFPDVLSMIVRSVRAGIPLHEALRVVARESLEPTATQFTRVVDQMAIGIRLDEALREVATRTGVAEYAFFTVALTLQAQTGGSLAETLDNLADVIRKRVALRLRAIALASEARTSAYVLAALPVVTGLVLSLVNYDYLRPLFETRGGNRVLFFAISLLCLAGTVMRFLIKRSLR